MGKGKPADLSQRAPNKTRLLIHRTTMLTPQTLHRVKLLRWVEPDLAFAGFGADAGTERPVLNSGENGHHSTLSRADDVPGVIFAENADDTVDGSSHPLRILHQVGLLLYSFSLLVSGQFATLVGCRLLCRREELPRGETTAPFRPASVPLTLDLEADEARTSLVLIEQS